jgi:hypothetical protein
VWQHRAVEQAVPQELGHQPQRAQRGRREAAVLLAAVAARALALGLRSERGEQRRQARAGVRVRGSGVRGSGFEVAVAAQRLGAECVCEEGLA